jgi:hypothetical protein
MHPLVLLLAFLIGLATGSVEAFIVALAAGTGLVLITRLTIRR